MLALSVINCLMSIGLICLFSTKLFKERLDDWMRVYFIFGFILIFVLSLISAFFFSRMPRL